MTKLCIFCRRRVNSDEHVWPQWLLRLMELWPGENMEFQAIRKNEAGLIDTWTKPVPEIVVGNVCKTCNGGWMSDLENEVAPILTPMIKGTPIVLTDKQQTIIAIWTTKCAILFDGIMNGGKGIFYAGIDKNHFRETLELGAHSYFWLGHYTGPKLRAYTRHGTKSGSKARTPFNAHIITFAFGRLVLQMLDIRFIKYQDGNDFKMRTDGQWSLHTIELCSQSLGDLPWPPHFSFDDSYYTFDKFSDRFGRLL